MKTVALLWEISSLGLAAPSGRPTFRGAAFQGLAHIGPFATTMVSVLV